MPRRTPVLAELPWSERQPLQWPSVSRHPTHQPVWELALKTGQIENGQTDVGQTGTTGGWTVSETSTDDGETGNESGNETYEIVGLVASQMSTLVQVSPSSVVGHHSSQKRREP